jgi:hypothetical protein
MPERILKKLLSKLSDVAPELMVYIRDNSKFLFLPECTFWYA